MFCGYGNIFFEVIRIFFNLAARKLTPHINMEKIIQAIVNFFRGIFGGNSGAENSYIPPIPEHLQPIPEKPKAPTEISVLPETPVTEKPEPAVTPKPVVKPTVVEKPKPIEEKPQIINVPAKTEDNNTLIIKLERYSKGQKEILGKLFIEDKLVCYTLEDQQRDTHVKGDTNIPTGEYEITLRNLGAMNDTYARRFSAIHKGMLWLRNVPNFEYILIHVGNTSADTMGCILVGTTPVEEMNSEMERSIKGSSAAYQKLYPIVAEHISKGGKAIIKITDNA